MKSAIRNVLLVGAGAVVSIPLSVLGIAAADSSGDAGDCHHEPGVQRVIHSWDGVMPDFKLHATGGGATQKQGQGSVVRNFLNNSNTTTVVQANTNENDNDNVAVGLGGAATGGAAGAQVIAIQGQGAPTAPLGVTGPIGPGGPAGAEAPAGATAPEAPAAEAAPATEQAAPEDAAAGESPAAGTASEGAASDDASADAVVTDAPAAADGNIPAEG